MTSKEFDTLNRFVISNNSFCNALNKGVAPVLDSTLKIELIIYYLTLNKEYLSSLNTPYKELYLSLIENHSYIIEDNYLLTEGIIITLESLINLVNEIEHSKTENNGKVIYFTNTNINHEPKIMRPQKSQIIQFSDAQKNIFYTSSERANIFERTTRVDQDTLPYINRTRHDFIVLMNDIILNALNDNLEGYNPKYLKVIAAYLKIFPFTVYAKDKKEIPFSEIELPKNEIGIRKTTIRNPLIDEIEKKLTLLIQRENCLFFERERFELDFSVSTKVLTLIEQELMEIEKEKNNYFFGLYVLKNSPELYNENLLTYITKSFHSGTIEINRFLANPIIKLFYIEHSKTEFHSSMRLDTLLKLINPDELLAKVSTQKSLKMEV